MEHIWLPEEELPIVNDTDIAVVGGSAAGITAALRLASAGRRVMVIESRTYLGREWTAALRPWIERADQAALPDWLREYVKPADEGSAEKTGRIAWVPDDFKRHLEDLLLDKGIQLLYASLPIGLNPLGASYGLVIANKSGRQIVRCKTVVDATETALVSALLGEAQTDFLPGQEAVYLRTLEYHGADLSADCELPVPELPDLLGGRVAVRAGADRVYVQYAMRLPSGNTLEYQQQRERAAMHAGIGLAEYLASNAAAFAKAKLTSASHELCGPWPLADGAMPRMIPDIPPCEPDWGYLRLGPVWSLFRDVYGRGNANWLNPVRAAGMADELARKLLAFGSDGDGGSPASAVLAAGSGGNAVGVPTGALPYKVRTGILDLLGERQASATVGAAILRNAARVEVLVAGGGSSGASAAIQAAKEGASTRLLDMNPGLGGTGTFGGVDSYWFGRRTGYALQIEQAVDRMQERLRYSGPKWNIEAKKAALMCAAEEAGAEVETQVLVFGAILKHDGEQSGAADRQEGAAGQGACPGQVCGAVYATRWGPRAVLADCVIDATGDGDLAAYAGADFVYGSERDHTVMWYSLAQFKSTGRLQNNFTSMVDVSDVRDYTRAILAGRRRGEQLNDHGLYIATRESRHVVGDVRMQLTDQLLHRAWEDTINIHFSNHDVKGVSGADWINIGLIPPNLEIEIPYRMLLPRGLEGLLVVGKAISATHDAFPAIRMQADLENLGGVAAKAAVLAIRRRTSLRAIPLEELRPGLVRDGVLPENILNRRLAPRAYSDAELEQLVRHVESEEPLFEYANMSMKEIYRTYLPFAEIATVGGRIVPFLEKALREQQDSIKHGVMPRSSEGTGEAPEHGERNYRVIHLAQALAMYASPLAVPVLIDAIERELQATDGLPVRTAQMMYVQLPPDHGAMPYAAHLLYSLAETRDIRSLDVWRQIAERFRPAEEDFQDTWQGLYYYVDAVCQGAERLGSPQAVPVLERLHAHPLLNGLQRSGREAVQADYFLERRAMLELALGRALARCGSPRGYSMLIAYLKDGRSLLRKHARTELQRLSRSIAGKNEQDISNPDEWQLWLSRQLPLLRPVPYENRLDRETASERLLRKPEHQA